MKRQRRASIVNDPDFDAIRAGLHREPCPHGCNEFLHLMALHPRRRSVQWDRIAAVFRELPRSERREIIRARRSEGLSE